MSSSRPAEQPAIRLRAACPRCHTPVAVRLAAGEVCPRCRSADAWARYAAAGEPLVISREDVERAVARRDREAQRSSGRRAGLLLSAAAVAAAVAAALLGARLWEFRELAPLEELRRAGLTAAVAVAVAGLAATAVGIAAAVILRRRALARAWLPRLAAWAAVAVGGGALALGLLFSITGWLGFCCAYDSMPALQAGSSVSPVVKAMMDATVVIVAPDGDGNGARASIGSGTIVRSARDRAWILTCSHVAMPYAATAARRDAARAHPVWVYVADGRHGRGRVEWTAQPPLDVAIISLALANPPGIMARFASLAGVEPGAVLFVPNPFRDGWMSHAGQVLRRREHITPAGEVSLIYTDLPVQPGDSGAGLFDSEGRLLGLNTWSQRDAQWGTLGISLPLEAMEALIAKVEAVE